MEFTNHTPFPSLTFQALDQHRQPAQVLVMRATLDMRADGTLDLSHEQEPLVLTDEYFGEPNRSSVRQESDLAPFKPRCDVVVNAMAYAPGGRPSPRFSVGIRINAPPREKGASAPPILEKKLVVTGPRKAFLEGKILKISGKPLTSLPIHYEFAFGGECRINRDDPNRNQVAPAYLLSPEQLELHPDGPDKAPLAHRVCESNPIGTGFVEPWYLSAARLKEIPFPQIECTKNPVLQIGLPYPPQGFGIISKSWQPRLKLAGTYDDAWLEQRWPDIPDDLDFAFWNGAHSDMQIPYLRGNETIQLTNLMPTGVVPTIQDSEGNSVASFELPGRTPHLFAQFGSGETSAVDFNIDTLIIDTENRKLSLVYRSIIPERPVVWTLVAKINGKVDSNFLGTAE